MNSDDIPLEKHAVDIGLYGDNIGLAEILQAYIEELEGIPTDKARDLINTHGLAVSPTFTRAVIFAGIWWAITRPETIHVEDFSERLDPDTGELKEDDNVPKIVSRTATYQLDGDTLSSVAMSVPEGYVMLSCLMKLSDFNRGYTGRSDFVFISENESECFQFEEEWEGETLIHVQYPFPLEVLFALRFLKGEKTFPFRSATARDCFLEPTFSNRMMAQKDFEAWRSHIEAEEGVKPASTINTMLSWLLGENGLPYLKSMAIAKRLMWKVPFEVRYKEEIDLFFREEHIHSNSPEKGHIWIAGQDRGFQALTVEPPEGGQYEIAIRFPLDADHPNPLDKYSGYIVVGGTMIGRNTDGH